ncbi:NAD(P)-dependent alcohol dehydrogenase [Amorphoplanes digitatis]|uniref:Aryl-alcohol dehydrogenase n=1 Tax=Actinoplanes digitatis TaxID=1868 RepID=A0A7W7MSY9_9ACTN|nr:NAD(P)-dependent alcohol dehydrogenase [Actinoplanes digitatis]MBB4765079.1 aryl-alcohol dehydrogenase [Actinoplanes digitatis]GID97644.1 aryl-alcohol dehydrogenase [Actinoplanes digitatis]
MSMQVTAAVARKPGEPLSIEELDLDDLRPNEVLVRMVASGVCHTDAIVRDQVYPTPLPAVLGHEGAGVVEQVGDGVTSVRPGDHVLLAAAYCGQCDRCRAGQMAYCENLFAADFGGRRPDGSTAFAKDGEAISSHFFGQSSFASHANVVQESVIKVDPQVPLEVVAPLGCGIQTGAGTVLNELRPSLNSSLVVIGTGAVGFGAIMAAKVAGCAQVIAVDIHPSRLELAMELGATDSINTREGDLTEEIMRLTGGKGANYVIDTTARPELLRKGADALGLRGTLALVGAANPGTEVSFEIGLSLVKGWTFKTVIQGSSVPQVFIPKLIELWGQGRFPMDRIMRNYRHEDINQGFEDSHSGRTIKPVIVY